MFRDYVYRYISVFFIILLYVLNLYLLYIELGLGMCV